MEATRKLKLEFLNRMNQAKFDVGRIVLSNIDDADSDWFYIQAGKNKKAKDYVHLEFTSEGNLEFHIEQDGSAFRKSNCQNGFDYFKTLPEFSDFDFENGGWNDCIKGYVAPYKIPSDEELTENVLFSAILTILPKIDGIITGYRF